MLQLLDGFDYGNMAVNDNWYVNILSPTVVITFKHDVGVQWNANDITVNSYEIPINVQKIIIILKNQSKQKLTVLKMWGNKA
jgi:hypothetical protein